jgi:hypothetical protein
MEINTKPSISKLVTSFDNELKAMLLEDLKRVKSTKDELLASIKQSLNVKSLSVA